MIFDLFFTFVCRYRPVLFVILRHLSTYFLTPWKKHFPEWSLSVIDHLCANRFANSHHTVLHIIGSLFYACSFFYHIPLRYLTGFIPIWALPCFVVLLRFIIFQRFFILHFHIFSVTRCHHSYNELASFAFFVFVHHTTHCFLLLVCYMFCGWKHCPEEAHMNRWAKRWLIIKYNQQKCLFICS